MNKHNLPLTVIFLTMTKSKRTRSNNKKVSGEQVMSEPAQEDYENPREIRVKPGKDRRREKLTLLISDAVNQIRERKLAIQQRGAILVSSLEDQFDAVEVLRYPAHIQTMKWKDYLSLLSSASKTSPIDSEIALEAECEAVVSKTPGRKKRGRPRKAAATSTARQAVEESSEVFSVPQVPQSNLKREKVVRLALHDRQDTSNFITPAIPTRFNKITVEDTPCNPTPEVNQHPFTVIAKFDLRTPGTASKRLPMPGEVFMSLRGSPMQIGTPERTEKIIPVGKNKAIKIVSMRDTGKRQTEPSAEVSEIYKSIMNLRSSSVN